MKLAFDSKELASTLLCGQLEVNNKPVLMRASLDGKKVLLLVVDMVKGFCESGALADTRCRNIVPSIRELVSLLSDADLVRIRDRHTDSSAELNYFPKHCVGKESEMIDELKGIGGTEITKNSTNALMQLLGARSNLLDYDEVVVAGVCTDICVLQLALSVRAYISEFNGHGNVIVFTDTVETFDSPTHNADLYNMMAIKLMEQSGVRIFKRLA